jgi:hypothetical protein
VARNATMQETGYLNPRGTPENRPIRDTSKPANEQ